MNRITTLIPYFGGISNAPRQTDLNNVLKYFKLCYESISDISDLIMVSVCNDNDEELMDQIDFFNDNTCTICHLNIDPMFNPANMNRRFQSLIKSSPDIWDTEYVFFTESDQIVYIRDLQKLLSIIDANKNVYIVPQRFEQIERHRVQDRKDQFGVKDDRFLEFDGVLKEGDNIYTVANEPPYDKNRVMYNDEFYLNFEEGPAYGAAFLCHKDLFMKTEFTDSTYQPTETSAGHNLLYHPDSKCIKALDFYEFYVDHLSGFEFNTRTLQKAAE